MRSVPVAGPCENGDRPKLKTKLLMSFGKNAFFFVLFILMCQNSQHVRTKRTVVFKRPARAGTNETRFVPQLSKMRSVPVVDPCENGDRPL